jgi:uncharacterized protein (TIGR03437 family)
MVKVKGVQAAGGVVEAAYIEVVPTATAADFESFPAVASVSASSYDTEVAPNSIAAAFGLNLARTTRGASTLPLPTELDGVCVTVDGIPAGLFFVSPGQINYLVPEGLQPGTAMVTVEINDEVIAQGELTIIENKPGFFTANASGSGAPAGALLRIASNGRQSYEPLARVEGNQVVAAPIKRNAGDALFLVLYGTGLAANLDDIEVTLNGTPARVLYAGAAPGFAGLNQLNLQLPENLPSGNLVISIKINDGDGTMLTGNAVTINVQ